MVKEADRKWAEQVFDQIQTKVHAEVERVKGGIPYIPEDGHYADMAKKDIIWWTNGFWGGILWQLYKATGDDIYKKYARADEDELDGAFTQYTGLHHDVGFMWLPTAVADYRLTENDRSRARGLHAADLLAGRYNPRGKFLRSWNRDRSGWVIIDSMINIQLLFWASETIDDPRYKYMAIDHANTVMSNHVRPDGSVNHICVFDPNNGDLLDTPGGQGYAPGSSWSRGQAWAIYGFTLTYLHTHDQTYLDTAKRVAHYFIANVEKTNYVPLVDFRAPKEPVKLDTSAGLTAACGLLEIADQVPEFEKALYEDAAVKLLRSVYAQYTNLDPETDGIVTHATGAYFDQQTQEQPIIYSDYYFIEGILRILNKKFLIW